MLQVLDRIVKVVGLENAQPYGEEEPDLLIPTGGARAILGISREAYIAALRAEAAKQNAVIYDDPDDRPPGLEIIEAEVVE